MTIIYLLLPLMLAVASGAVLAFVWVARSGQLDDLDTPPLRMLGEDDPRWPATRTQRNVTEERP